MAAQIATTRVIRLADDADPSLVAALEKMRLEAEETEQRCTDLAGSFEGKKTAILEEARTTKGKGADMLKIYLDKDSDAFDGFEFLTMCEAGEVGHWHVLQQMGAHASHDGVEQLVQWALPIQQRHFEGALEGSKVLAAREDPNHTE